MHYERAARGCNAREREDGRKAFQRDGWRGRSPTELRASLQRTEESSPLCQTHFSSTLLCALGEGAIFARVDGLRIPTQGSFVILEVRNSVRPNHLFELNRDRDYYFELPAKGAGCSINFSVGTTSMSAPLNANARPPPYRFFAPSLKTAQGRNAHTAFSLGTIAPVRGRFRCRGRDPIAGRQNRSCVWGGRHSPD